MDADKYHRLLAKVLNETCYPFYVVHPDLNYRCSCNNSVTKQADPKCKKCLGTGQKIRIRQIEGLADDELKGGNMLGVEKSQVVKNYFIKRTFNLYEGDYIFDNEQIYYVFRVMNLKGLHGYHTHQEVICSRKNNDREVIYNNFKDILKHYYALHKKKGD